MVSKSVLVGASVAGVCVVGYCIYFDRKRRSDPLYKEKIRNRRAANQKARKTQQVDVQMSNSHKIPKFQDVSEIQPYIFQQIQEGEEYLTSGDFDNAADSFANAVAVCDQPQMLIMALQQSTPPEVFGMIRERVPFALQRLKQAMGADIENEELETIRPVMQIGELEDEDLE